jgi:hypothetical protein
MEKNEVIRQGVKVTTDRDNINSDCNQISFINLGDTPVTVTLRDTDLSFVLAGKTDTKTDYLIFGGVVKGLVETSLFDVAFSAIVTTKNLQVMRVHIKA